MRLFLLLAVYCVGLGIFIGNSLREQKSLSGRSKDSGNPTAMPSPVVREVLEAKARQQKEAKRRKEQIFETHQKSLDKLQALQIEMDQKLAIRDQLDAEITEIDRAVSYADHFGNPFDRDWIEGIKQSLK